jgi:hypothetical protein
MFTSTSLNVENDFLVIEKENKGVKDFIRVGEQIFESSMNNVEDFFNFAPKAFTENRGQLENDEIRFYDQGGDVWFTDDGMWLELREYAEPSTKMPATRRQGDFNSMDRYIESEPTSFKRVILKQEFLGANKVRPVGKERLGWNYNYFYGNDSNKWCTDVLNYGEVFYENLYDRIDLRYYTTNNGLKYDFIIQPGAKPELINLKYSGAEAISINDCGNLVIETEINSLIENKPFIYQLEFGQKKSIDGQFRIHGNNKYGFRILGEYDKSRPLVIDPLVKMEYSSFLGGMDYNYGTDVETYSVGYPYVTGYTRSTDFPKTTGSYQPTKDGGYDCFVLKFNKYGTILIYGSFLGGVVNDYAMDIEVDSNGNAYVVGDTRSSDFPTTDGCFDPNYDNHDDAFVFKLNPSGNILIYSTYLNGDDEDKALGLAVDSNSVAYVTGYTRSSGFPVSNNAYDEFHNSQQDVFALKLNSAGSTIISSTFIGGFQKDIGYDITADSNGNMYVTGITESNHFPTTPDAYDTKHSGAFEGDVFVIKLNSAATSLVYSTFVKGDYDDVGYSIVLDKQHNAIIAGDTWSSNFPTTPGVIDSANSGRDAFICKLNHNASNLIFSTFFGGNSGEVAYDMELDANENIYLTGYTGSQNFQVTDDAFDDYNNNQDGFFVILNNDCTHLFYSTYIGDTYDETGTGIAIDQKGNVFITGETKSSNFYTTSSAYDNSFGGTQDLFLQKYFVSSELKINNIKLIDNDSPSNKIFTKLQPYIIRANITDTISSIDLLGIEMILDPDGADIQLYWNRTSDNFSEISDPKNYVDLKTSTAACKDLFTWNIDFNLIFDWTYPHEKANNVKVIAYSSTMVPVNLTKKSVFVVENDLKFNGTLIIKDSNNNILEVNDLVKGGGEVTFTGLVPVYEGATDLYPTIEDLKVVVWDDKKNSWSQSLSPGEAINIQITTQNKTKPNGSMYTMNLSGIPPECDSTNIVFRFYLDADPVEFTNYTPSNRTWHTNTKVLTGVTITDFGGGEVDGRNIKYRISTSEKLQWTNWKSIPAIKNDKFIKINKEIKFVDGINNLIEWRANDTVGNGPTVSETQRILVDSEDVEFLDIFPLESQISPTKKVDIGVILSDPISGINTSSIEYAISANNGIQWGPWIHVPGYENDTRIDMTTSYIFKNGTENKVKWRANDIAGNGPVESDEYTVKVNVWLNPIKPKTTLVWPQDGKIIKESTIELEWKLNNVFDGVLYDLYFDNTNPPSIYKSDIDTPKFEVDDLISGETYYWKVIPRLDDMAGICDSGVWEFSVELLDGKKKYDVNIDGPGFITVNQGDSKSVMLKIWNLGIADDTVMIELHGGELDEYIKIHTKSEFNLYSNKSKEIFLDIDIPKSLEVGTYEIQVTATSKESLGAQSDTLSIIVQILKKADTKKNITSDDSEPINFIAIGGVTTIIIIIVIVIIFLFHKKRKKKQIVDYKLLARQDPQTGQIPATVQDQYQAQTGQVPISMYSQYQQPVSMYSQPMQKQMNGVYQQQQTTQYYIQQPTVQQPSLQQQQQQTQPQNQQQEPLNKTQPDQKEK